MRARACVRACVRACLCACVVLGLTSCAVVRGACMRCMSINHIIVVISTIVTLKIIRIRTRIKIIIFIISHHDNANNNKRKPRYTGPSAGFAVIHGLVDRIMELVAVDPTPTYNAADPSRCVLKNSRRQYHVVHGEDPAYLPGQCADIVVTTTTLPDPAGGAEGGASAASSSDAAAAGAGAGAEKSSEPTSFIVGTFGILHPEVLKNFSLEFPGSMLEMDLECFL